MWVTNPSRTMGFLPKPMRLFSIPNTLPPDGETRHSARLLVLALRRFPFRRMKMTHLISRPRRCRSQRSRSNSSHPGRTSSWRQCTCRTRRCRRSAPNLTEPQASGQFEGLQYQSCLNVHWAAFLHSVIFITHIWLWLKGGDRPLLAQLVSTHLCIRWRRPAAAFLWWWTAYTIWLQTGRQRLTRRSGRFSYSEKARVFFQKLTKRIERLRAEVRASRAAERRERGRSIMLI